MAFMVGIALMAQHRPAQISSAMKYRAVPAPIAIDNSTFVTQAGNPVANTKAVMDDVLGNSATYDMQSNAAMMSRLYRFEDGTISGTWTTAYASGASDRGSGYNYYNGTSWGSAPTARIETVRTGWPNVNPWMGNGELVVAHNSTTSLVFNSRPVKGTGSWTQSLPMTSPTGITSLVWPRAITNGNNHQNVHIIVVGQGSLGGQTAALLYYRSLDGGSTFDKSGVVLPGLDGTNYLAFGGDDYAWVEPHGDTIAFCVAGSWTDTFLMYSYDNGSTWTKKLIFPNYYGLAPAGTVTPMFICTDGTIAGAMDKNGVFHVAFGRMRASDDGGGHSYYPGTDGIVYWNSTMPALDTAIISDDTFFDSEYCLGYVAANATGDSILSPFPYYGVSLSSFPQVTIDDYNNLYVLWSSLTVGNPSPDPFNYRHIWGRAKYNGHTEWSEMKDLNEDIIYMFQEYVYPAVAKSIKNDKILMLTQTSSQPGSNIKDATIPVHEVNFEYREVPSSYWIMTGQDNKQAGNSNLVGKNYPNPVKDMTSFNFKMEKAANVIVEVSNIMGQKVMTMNMGTVSNGGHKFTIDASQLTSGIYFYTVKIGNETYSQKMIVE